MKNFMPDMHDQELDDLFRKAADKYTPAHKEEVWKKLEAKLAGKPDGRRPKGAWWKLPAVLLLLGAIGYLIWPYGGSDRAGEQQLSSISTKEKQQHDSSSIAKINEDKPLASGKEAAVPSRESSGHKPTVVSGINTRQNLVSGKQLNAPPPSRELAQPESIWSENAKHDRKQSMNNSSKKDRTANGHESSTTKIDVPAALAPVLYPKHPTTHPTHPKFNTHPDALYSNEKDASIPEQDVPELSHVQPDKKSMAPGKMHLPDSFDSVNKKHWSFGLTAGPEWNGVAGSGWDIGVSGGLKITYRLNSKWALTSGALLSKKMYKAKPKDYDPVDDYWRNYDVRNIDAECIIWDIPLNISYTILKDKKNTVHFSTGLSSIWMPEEKYTYFYKTSSGGWDQWSKEVYGANHHIFSILNISAGYTHTWKRFSLEAAPYFKIPLKGIGYGRVKLYSAGIHLTFQYDGLK